jgi:hypothetical protein
MEDEGISSGSAPGQRSTDAERTTTSGMIKLPSKTSAMSEKKETDREEEKEDEADFRTETPFAEIIKHQTEPVTAIVAAEMAHKVTPETTCKITVPPLQLPLSPVFDSHPANKVSSAPKTLNFGSKDTPVTFASVTMETPTALNSVSDEIAQMLEHVRQKNKELLRVKAAVLTLRKGQRLSGSHVDDIEFVPDKVVDVQVMTRKDAKREKLREMGIGLAMPYG